MTTQFKRHIPYAEYDALQAMRSSRLKHTAVSMLEYNHQLTVPWSSTAALEFGTAVHCAVLEPALFETTYAVWTNGNRAGKVWAATRLAYPNRKYVHDHEMARIRACRDAVLSHPDVQQFFTGRYETEVTLGWTDEKTGIACKARPDIERGFGWNGDQRVVLAGLKTARSIDKRDFARQAEELGYVLSWGMYFEGYRIVTGQKADMYEIVVESEEPFDVAVFRIPSDVVDDGVDKFRAAMDRVAACQKSGKWPGRYEKVQEFERPGWAQERESE